MNTINTLQCNGGVGFYCKSKPLEYLLDMHSNIKITVLFVSIWEVVLVYCVCVCNPYG